MILNVQCKKRDSRTEPPNYIGKGVTGDQMFIIFKGHMLNILIFDGVLATDSE